MADGSTDTTYGQSRDRGTVMNWLLLDGNRLVIAGIIVLVSLLVVLGLLWSFGTASLRPDSPVYFLFSSLLTGDLTLLTVVLSINQLVLSRELGAPGSLQTRIDETLDYRSDVEAVAESAESPSSLPDFLRFLHENVVSRAQALDETAGELDDDRLQRRLRSLSESLREDARAVNQTLDRESTGAFGIISATVETSHSSQLHEIGRIRTERDDTVSGDLSDALGNLRGLLLQIDVARRYFRTVYVQKELAYLSRILLYVGVPAIIGSGITLILYNTAIATTVPTVLFLSIAVVAFTVGITPLAVLFPFILRLAWVAQRTTTIAPFISE